MRWLLLIHVLAAVAYLGPSLGGTFMYLSARRQGDRRLILWTLRQSLILYNVEHAALLVLLGSGLAMLALGKWALLATAWVRWKLAVVAGIILPVEVWDVVAVNVLLARALRQAAPTRGRRRYAAPCASTTGCSPWAAPCSRPAC